jgi:quinoprotein glucose dehydrogenase
MNQISPVNLVMTFVLLSLGATIIYAGPQHELGKPPEEPKIAAASKEGEESIAKFKVTQGMQTKLVAAEPLVANPCAFSIDNLGRIYVCETFRQGHGIEDNRGHEYWLNDDLAAQTVADRVAYIKKHHAKRLAEYTRYDDRIRLLWDANGDGKMDQDAIFVKHFNQIEDGTGAGVLPIGDQVLFTCIPKLWSLRDANGDNVADERKALLDGFGVRFAFRGHDLHGLIMGPDGRVYFSIGDRGYNVTSQEGKQFVNPESGAVFRCEIDGSGLEVVATGLRNPQELAFDDHGNLFTGDNNSDSGDKARWVYVVEGGDTGWRMAYQYLPDRGPFNREKIWHPFHAGQPAYIVPPIVNFADGPSGLAFYPGTGLPDHFKNRFFLCDFRGTPNNSGIKTFRNEPDGATFKLIDAEESIWSILATDVDFAPDGGVYVADWVEGWNGEGKGRIYRFSDQAVDDSAIVKQVAALLRSGVSKSSSEELVSLLAHADRRIRQLAQWEIVKRGEHGVLIEAAKTGDSTLPRLHAIWGLSQLLRTSPNAAELTPGVSQFLVSLLGDADEEVRCQAAWVIGDRNLQSAASTLLEKLAAESPRCQHFFATALGKLETPEAAAALLSVLAQNDNRDPIVRHGAVMGLVGAGAETVHDMAKNHLSAATRLGAVVALRKLSSPLVVGFLKDSDAQVKLEAARAIHDMPITEAMGGLAAIELHSNDDDALVRRVLNARFRVGDAGAAESLAAYAGRNENPREMRVEALRMLAEWAKPNSRDRVLGMWRPIAPRGEEVARASVLKNLGALISAPEVVRNQAVKTAVSLGIKEIAPELLKIVKNTSESGESRGAALGALVELKAPDVETLVNEGLRDREPLVRIAALEAFAKREGENALATLSVASNSPAPVERQAVVRLISAIKSQRSEEMIAQRVAKLSEEPADVRLDLVEAAKTLGGRAGEALESWKATLDANDPLALYRPAMEGGNAERGRAIFFGKADVSCVRCHKIGGTGGEVGPDLSQIAKDKSREYLLESIVLPSKTIAKNFESVIIHDADGRVLTGVLKGKTDEATTLITAEGKVIEIANADIDEQSFGKSAMPEDLHTKMSPFELRDVVEFLSTLK